MAAATQAKRAAIATPRSSMGDCTSLQNVSRMNFIYVDSFLFIGEWFSRLGGWVFAFRREDRIRLNIQPTIGCSRRAALSSRLVHPIVAEKFIPAFLERTRKTTVQSLI